MCVNHNWRFLLPENGWRLLVDHQNEIVIVGSEPFKKLPHLPIVECGSKNVRDLLVINSRIIHTFPVLAEEKRFVGFDR